jgi:hypothetical protein
VLIFCGYIVLIGIIKLNMPPSSKYNKSFVIFAGALLFLICSLRNAEFGPDTLSYVSDYLSLSYINILDLWGNFDKDPFFFLFSKIISLFGVSYQVWLAIIAAIFIFSVSKLIYRYSSEAYLSFIVLLSLEYLFFSLTGLRQALALSMILLSYPYLREQKLIPFLVLVFFGSLFHSSALIFLIAYPLAKMKIGWKQFIGTLSALILSYFFSDVIKDLVALLGWKDYLSSYAAREYTLTISGFIIQLSIFLFCIYYKKGVLQLDINNLSLYNLLFLGLTFQAFAVVIAEFFRISMYFSIFSIILIPIAVNAEKNILTRRVVYTLACIALVSYLIIAGNFNGFIFYWQ